jgi:hypothetical protein
MNVSKKGSEQRPLETMRVYTQSSKPNKTSGTILQNFQNNAKHRYTLLNIGAR